MQNEAVQGTLFEFLTLEAAALNRHIHNGEGGQKRPISRIWPRREMKEDLQADPEKVVGLCGVLFLGLVLFCWVSCVP